MKKEKLYEIYADRKPVVLDDAVIARLRPLLSAARDDGAVDGELVITRSDAAEDIELFFELLRYCYAGYEYYAAAADFGAIKAECIASLEGEQLSQEDVFRAIYDALSPIVNDSHFSFFLSDGTRKSFMRLHCAYFTGVTLMQSGDGYEVVSGTDLAPVGHMFSSAEVDRYLFETLPAPDGGRRYLLGICTDSIPDSLKIGSLALPLHHCKTDYVVFDASVGEWDIDGVPVVHNGSFIYGNIFDNEYKKSHRPGDDYAAFHGLGEKYKNAPHLIWSLLSNHGGDSNYPMNFIHGLNDYAVWETQVVVLDNPIIKGGGENMHRINGIYSNEPVDLSKSKYEGSLYVLQNKDVASSGESALMYARSVKNVTFIGSSSCGCGQFGDVRRYRLPHSRIEFQMGFKVFNMDGFEEGIGIAPDYWLDSDDPVGDVAKWIRKTKMES